jgi:hypothetical protein
MKKLLIIFCFLTIIISGCRYKEGPLISFRSVERRLNGTWQVIGLTSDGIDSLQYYNDSCGSKMNLEFYYPDGSPIYDTRIGFDGDKKGFGGGISLSDNKKVMNVSMNNGATNYWRLGPIGNGKSNWKILKLTMKELKISTDYNGRNYRISFKKLSKKF